MFDTEFQLPILTQFQHCSFESDQNYTQKSQSQSDFLKNQKSIEFTNFKSFKSTNKIRRLSLNIAMNKSFRNVYSQKESLDLDETQKRSFRSTQISLSSPFGQQRIREGFFMDIEEEECFLMKIKDFQCKYQLLEKIGEGAHSSVYKTKNLETNQIFAVKICQNVDQQMKDILIKQYKMLKILDHPNVLKAQELIYDQEQQKTYFVSELCQYNNLRQEIIQRQQMNSLFSQKEVLDIVQKVLKTLQYVQNCGICHRDIKPENILYNPSTGQIKLIDFDIASQRCLKKQEFMMWTLTGTLQYRAPETFTIGYGQKIDIWSIGILMYELLVGEVPFQSKYQMQTINKIKNEKLQLQKFNFTNKTKLLLTKMLEKQASQRYNCQECLQFFKKEKAYQKDDNVLSQLRKNEIRNHFQTENQCYFQTESIENLFPTHRIKIDYLNWRISILKE